MKAYLTLKCNVQAEKKNRKSKSKTITAGELIALADDDLDAYESVLDEITELVTKEFGLTKYDYDQKKEVENWIALDYYLEDGIDIRPDGFGHITVENRGTDKNPDWHLVEMEVMENPWDKIELTEVSLVKASGADKEKIADLVKLDDKLNNLKGNQANYVPNALYKVSGNVRGAMFDPSGRAISIVYENPPETQTLRKPRMSSEGSGKARKIRRALKEKKKQAQADFRRKMIEELNAAAKKKAEEILSSFSRGTRLTKSLIPKGLNLRKPEIKPLPIKNNGQIFRDFDKIFTKDLFPAKMPADGKKPKIIYKRYAERKVYVRRNMVKEARVSDRAVKEFMKSSVAGGILAADSEGLTAVQTFNLFKNFYICLVVALFFQMLVSNTPIDENYTYERTRKRVRQSRTSHFNGDGSLKTTEQYVTDRNARLLVTTEHHKADKYKVRADWVLTFRGKNFKAFRSEHEPGSDIMSVDFEFYEDWFRKKSDFESAMKIAQVLYIQTGKSSYDATKDNILDFGYTNMNPRWELLEYGGYAESSNNRGARRGSKYKFRHGVKNGFTFQAPKGFVRLTESYWNSKVRSNAFGAFITKFLNDMAAGERLNVTKENSKLVKELLRKDNFAGTHSVKEDEIQRLK